GTTLKLNDTFWLFLSMASSFTVFLLPSTGTVIQNRLYSSTGWLTPLTLKLFSPCGALILPTISFSFTCGVTGMEGRPRMRVMGGSMISIDGMLAALATRFSVLESAALVLAIWVSNCLAC